MAMEQNNLPQSGDGGVHHGRSGGLMGWYYGFLDSHVKSTPSKVTVPLFAWLHGMLLFLQFYLERGGDALSLPMLIAGALLWGIVIGFVFYWVGGAFSYIFVRIVGGKGFMVTRRLLLYFGIMCEVLYLFSLLLVYFGRSMGDEVLFPVLSPLVTLVGLIFLFVLLYKGFKHVMGLSLGQFLLGLIVLPLVVIGIIFVVVVFGLAVLVQASVQ